MQTNIGAWCEQKLKLEEKKNKWIELKLVKRDMSKCFSTNNNKKQLALAFQ